MASGISNVSTEELVAELILRISRMQSALLSLERDNTELRLEIVGLKAQMLAGSVSPSTKDDLN